MTETSSEPTKGPADPDGAYEFRYGHGRMPFFMKIVWLAFLVFATAYVTTYLLTSLDHDLSALGS